MRPSVTEAQLQAQIVEGLRALGYEVLVTSARSVRQGYGADHGVPDLLVSRHDWHKGSWMGLEVKKPGPVRWSHARQRELWQAERTAIVRSLEDAAFAVCMFSLAILKTPPTAIVALATHVAADETRTAEVFHHAG